MRAKARLFAYIAGVSLVLLCTLVGAQAPVAVPSLSAHVTDLTATLPTPRRDALEAKLVSLEQRKGAQLAVLLVPSTQPETIEQYAIRVFDAWKLGRKGVDDGVLLLVAKGDRKVRIEVGRGLEGAIPDAIARRIIDEYLTPHFREGDFGGGIDAATDALQKLVDGEALPMPYRSDSGGDSGMDDKALFMSWLFLSAVLSALLGMLAWPLRLPIVGSISAFVMYLLGVGAPMFVIAGVGSALMSLFMNNTGRSVSGGGSGGWSSGGLSSSDSGGGWSSGSSSGSSWSGGGGSSAGGGASGSW